MGRIQSQSEWEEEMSVKVLRFVQKELYMDFRFLDVALSALEWKGDSSLAALATDGSRLYYPPGHLLEVFEKNPQFWNRAYLHTTLHCVFSHLWLCGGRERERWNLACDIAVERVIDRAGKDCTRRPLAWLRQRIYDELDEAGAVSAAEIYSWLKGREEGASGEDSQKLMREFYTDSHKYWKQEDKGMPHNPAVKNTWDKIARQSRMEMERRGSETTEGEKLLAKELKSQRSRRSYQEFLRRFAVLREEMHCDMDEFDLNYYTYGLELYGNMPLIEPLESREVMRIQEFVIVVDTSDSTNGELVKNFLKETFAILTQANSFSQKCHIRILQCDDKVRMDEKITSREELEQLMERFTLAGGGGTDFRPAFAYVNELVADGELRDLRGMLYFTDGKGIYPKTCPDYDAAFLYLDEYEEAAVPPWAMRLRLSPEEFCDENRGKSLGNVCAVGGMFEEKKENDI